MASRMVNPFLLFSRSVASNSLRPHWLQHFRLPCPSPSPGACSNSCPSSQWCHPTISSSVCCLLLLLPSIFPSIRVFSSSSHQVAKIVLKLQLQHQSLQWTFRVDFLRIDWFDLLAVQGIQESSPTPQFKSINSLVLSFLSPTLTSIHDYWKNHSFD